MTCSGTPQARRSSGTGTLRPAPYRRGVSRLLAGIAAALVGLAGTLVIAAPAHAETVREAQWHLRELDIAAVHRITKGAGVLVAVVDTGVEASHPDLRGQVQGGTGIGEGAGPAGGTVDVDGHGTHMAGIIAARGGGANHALGIAPEAKILPVRISSKGPASARDLADGIRWAADHGAKVINVSLADDREEVFQYETEAIAYALAKDAVVIAGAGNRPEGHRMVGVPARIPGVVAVGATTRSGRLWSGSLTGPEVVIAAPGEDIVATGSKRAGSKSGYVTGTGTSSATAVVSGAVALIRAKFPELKAPDVINRLIMTADDAGPDGRDEEFGFGTLNIRRALTADVPSVKANPLGVPDGASPAPSRGSAAGGEDTNPMTGRVVLGLVILGLAVIGLPLLLIVLLVVALRRRRRRRSASAAFEGMPPPGGSYPAGGWPPASPPPHQPSPGGWPATPTATPTASPPPGGYPSHPYPYPGSATPGQAPFGQPSPGQPSPSYPGPAQQPWPGSPHSGGYSPFPGQPGSGHPPTGTN